MPRKKPRRARIARNERREMDEGHRRFMIKYARENLWRVVPDYDLEDLIQEGLWCWCYVLAHYPRAKSPAHLQRLFQLTFHSHITSLSRKRTREREAIEVVSLEPSKIDHELQSLYLLIARAPARVRAVLELFANPTTRKLLRYAHKRRAPGTRGLRETRNDRFCRLTGEDPETNLAGEVREYLSSL